MEITRVHISDDSADFALRFPDDAGFIVIGWVRESKISGLGVEFGEIILTQKKDGTTTIDSETMRPEFVKEVLCALVDKAKFVG